ncbi:hypothetical protein ACTVZO_42680 [Streptomyces sp. IBSNAI002]|uniref:hypothetical protein n=1 Tax=Streptomyces sp. IBSNAI002 TaxID=3457500 RepID=UPI003FD44DE1
MARKEQTLAIGAAFIFLLAGCESSESSETPSPNHSHSTSLADLETVAVTGDPLADTAGPVKIIAELQYGTKRLVAYVNNDSCGILTDSNTDPTTANRIHLVSKWPAPGEGSNSFPAGPYNSASGFGGPKSWASLLCGKNAMVIEFVSGEDSAPEQLRGQVAVTQVTSSPPTSRIIIGEPAVRKEIEDWQKSETSGTPATTPQAQ